jgi:hypothetical protein
MAADVVILIAGALIALGSYGAGLARGMVLEREWLERHLAASREPGDTRP